MKRSIELCCLLTAALSWPSAAAPASGGTHPPGELLAAMLEALGGRPAIAEVRSLAVEAACSGPGGPFTTRVESQGDGTTYFRQAARDRLTEIWSRPRRTWSINAGGEVAEHPPAVREFVRNHEFHLLLLEIEDRFSEHRPAGTEELAGRLLDRLDMRDESGAPASLWLDPESAMPVALELHPEGAAGALRMVFDDWQTIDGVRFFRSFDLTEGAERRFRYDYAAIRVNPPPAALSRAPIDAEQARLELLAVLEEDRRAHLRTDASLLAAHLDDTLLEVSTGVVSPRTRQEVADFFATSWRDATFDRWEDLEPPHIRLSADGSMAWVVRRITAERRDPRDGELVRTRYTSAYTATYERRHDRWRMTSITSTFPPP